MRAGPLSNKKVISLLNQFFVPVFVVNEDYAKRGSAPAQEKAERDGIIKATHAAKLSAGSVHVYLLRPDGTMLDSMHVAKAARTTNLIAMLQKAVDELNVTAAGPVVAPRPQAPKPPCDSADLAVHLVVRSLDGKGAWSEFPVENWIILNSEDQRAFVPARSLKVGDKWLIDAAVADKLLTHVYPATENNDVSKNKFLDRELQAEVLSIGKGAARIQLAAKLKMAHSFYHKDDGKVVDATLVGVMRGKEGKIESLRMVTEEATYNSGKFGAAFRTVN